MNTVLNESLAGTPKHGLKGLALEALGQTQVVPAPTSRTARPEAVPCFHCGVKTRNTSEWVVKGDGMGCGGRVAMGPQGVA